MKEILYVLLYSPYIEWVSLKKWIKDLIDMNSQAQQFLLYFNKVWLTEKNIWHVGDELQASVLTNCALKSYHKRLNSELKTNPLIDSFSKSLYRFDMKSYRELHQCRKVIPKYQKFISKEPEIINLMDKILNDCKIQKENGQDKLNEDEPNADVEAETWYMYNESNNTIFHEYLFGDSLGNN